MYLRYETSTQEEKNMLPYRGARLLVQKSKVNLKGKENPDNLPNETLYFHMPTIFSHFQLLMRLSYAVNASVCCRRPLPTKEKPCTKILLTLYRMPNPRQNKINTIT